MERGADWIVNLPAWTGSSFTAPKINHQVPPSMDPARQSLPSPFVTVVTGASRGIGAATAKTFAQAGATGLVLTARSADSLQKTEAEIRSIAKDENIKIVKLAADNALESSAIDVASAIKQEFNGQLDLLVNNAGILSVTESAFSKIADMESPNIEVPTNCNYIGRFYMIKHLIPLLLASDRPTKSIINISSIGGHLSGPLGFSISALATNRLSQRVAEAYAEDGIFCAAMHPGAVMPETIPAGFPRDVADWSIDSPSLCGSFIIWLVKERREFLNGRYLDATWDVEELLKKKEDIVANDKLKMRLVV